MAQSVPDRANAGENALLVQPYPLGRQDASLLEEFTELARSAGAVVVGTVTARIERPNASHYIGSGKVEEVLAACEACDATLVLFNHTLSPVQERNLSKALDRRVVDRTGLILDIFAQRALHEESCSECASSSTWGTPVSGQAGSKPARGSTACAERRTRLGPSPLLQNAARH